MKKKFLFAIPKQTVLIYKNGKKISGVGGLRPAPSEKKFARLC